MDDDSVLERVRAVDAALARVEDIADEQTRDAALSAIQGLLDLYGETLGRMLNIVAQRCGPEVLHSVLGDELVEHILLVHGLHPVDLESRVRKALDDVQATVESHGARVELIGLQDAVAHLRLNVTCSGCASSEHTLRQMIEDAIRRAAPDVEGVEVESESPTSLTAGSFIALERLVPAGG